MCGIVGLISKDNAGFFHSHADLFKNMLAIDTIRGADSTGIFGVDKEGRVDIVKGDADGYTFVSSANYKEVEKKIVHNYRIIIGHNRKASKGEISPQNAHPFKEKHIVLVHNGFIQNSVILNNDVDVDSHAIAHELAKGNAKDALEKLRGAFAIVWYNQFNKTLNLTRNKERPLWLLEYKNYWGISSEMGLLYWLSLRDDNKKPIMAKELKEETIYTFYLDNLEKDPVESDYDEYKIEPFKVYYQSQYQRDVKQLQAPAAQSMLTSLDTKIKRGDTITVQITDHQEKQFQLLGHPVFSGNQIDQNMIVKCPISPAHNADFIYKAKLFQGTVMSTSILNGVPIIYVNAMSLKAIPDKEEDEPSKLTDLEEMIAEGEKRGCGRCGATIRSEKINDSLFRKRADGTWRVLCSQCLVLSLTESKEARKERMQLVN